MFCIGIFLEHEACAEGLAYMQSHLIHGKISILTTLTHSSGQITAAVCCDIIYDAIDNSNYISAEW